MLILQKKEYMTIKEFMNRDYEKKGLELSKFIKENKKTIILVATGTAVSVLVPKSVLAATGAAVLDAKMKGLYFGTFVNIAKWIVIGKGCVDCATNAVREDFKAVKRSAIQMGMSFTILLALPWALEEIQGLFMDLIDMPTDVPQGERYEVNGYGR